MSNSQQLQQTQQMRLQQRINPRQVALGRVLEMSVPEFDEEIRRRLDENPALTTADGCSNDSHDSHDDIASENTARTDDSDDFGDEADADSLADTPMQNLSANSFDPTAIAADDERGMVDTIMDQLATDTSLDAEGMNIASHIAGNLDNSGYLRRPLNDIALDIAIDGAPLPSPEQMQDAFHAIRAIDPPGIGAVDLRDCLLLQLQRRKPGNTIDLARRIIHDHFDLFSNRHFDRLATATAASREQLTEAMEAIRRLNPRPGAGLGSGKAAERSVQVQPDFLLDYDPYSERLRLSLGGFHPELAIEETFAADPSQADGVAPAMRTAADYIKSRRDAAADFIELARRRAATLTAIGRAIVGKQQAYFRTGNTADIRPMILRDIADSTGYDISTISRAVSGKYIQTPHGIVALRNLFSERPNAETDLSAPAILEALRSIIDNEDKTAPLSDRQLTDALAARGLDIARRTVAKYRERLGVPVARLRKGI